MILSGPSSLFGLCLTASLLAGCIDAFPSFQPGDAAVDRGADVSLDDGVPQADRGSIQDAQPADSAPIPDGAIDAQHMSDMADAQPDMAGDASDMAGDAQPDGPVDMGCVPAEETCNGLDDDCDGQTDEQLSGVGDACSNGLGMCAAEGSWICDPDRGELVCDAMPGEGIDEICNAFDDDCDGNTDEELGLGDACSDGLGLCRAEGVFECGVGDMVVCSAVPGMPGEERCEGSDEDCDGMIDEGFDVGAACEVGVGICLNRGENVCEAGGAVCNVEPLPAAPSEACNELDDDCDGRTDEDIGKGDACQVGIGVCLASGQNVCDADGRVVCDAVEGDPVEERCDGLDNDCDGPIDETFPLGEECFNGVGQCRRQGEFECGDDGAERCNAEPAAAERERCDGLDNDCDGLTDEGNTCASEVTRNCRVWLGWANRFNHNAQRSLNPSMTMGDCPASPEDQGGTLRCNSTRGDGNWRSFGLDGTMNGDDLLTIRFECDQAIPAAAWAQDHCEVFLAYGDVVDPEGEVVLEGLDPESCGSTFSHPTVGRAPGCVRTGHDTDFHPIATIGVVNNDDAWGVAFRCEDPELQDRAAGVQSNVLVRLAAQARGRFGLGCVRDRIDNVAAWNSADGGDCPLIGNDSNGRETCASSSGDGQFHAFQTTQGDLGRCWAFGVSMQPRPAVQGEN